MEEKKLGMAQEPLQEAATATISNCSEADVFWAGGLLSENSDAASLGPMTNWAARGQLRPATCYYQRARTKRRHELSMKFL